MCLMTREVDKLIEFLYLSLHACSVRPTYVQEPLLSTVAAQSGDVHRHAAGLKHAQNHCRGACVCLGVGPPTWHLSWATILGSIPPLWWY